jgi:DNA repair protein RadC
VLDKVSDDELLKRLIGRRVDGPSLGSLLELEREGMREAGLSEAEASAVSVVAEIARRHQPRDTELEPLRYPAQAVSLLSDLRRSGSAQLILMNLDRRQRLLSAICASQAAGGCAIASPAAVTEQAQLAAATSVIIAHNHLRGFATPTSADVTFTGETGRSLGTVGIDLMDHLVVARRGWFSFRREGLLF